MADVSAIFGILLFLGITFPGAPDESRSHFKAMELIEREVDDERGPASGWISRHLS